MIDQDASSELDQRFGLLAKAEFGCVMIFGAS